MKYRIVKITQGDKVHYRVEAEHWFRWVDEGKYFQSLDDAKIWVTDCREYDELKAERIKAEALPITREIITPK